MNFLIIIYFLGFDKRKKVKVDEEDKEKVKKSLCFT